jgi:hypothetical protein
VAGAKLKKKTKPSPASVPITPEVEAPPKSSSSTISRKDEEVIHIDDDAENVVDSSKDASSSMPSIDVPVKITAEAPDDDATKNMELAHGTPATHLQFFSFLRKAPLHQRYKEITNLMNEVWGNLETEQQDMVDFEDSFRTFFTKHKAVRQVTLAPKHWITPFPSKELGRCLTCYLV